MSDPKNLESGSEPAIEGLPIPKIEGASTGSPTSGVDMEALAEKVAAKLRPDFEKVAQSTKDKRIAAIEKKLGVELADLESLGVAVPDNVKTELRFRELERQRQSESPAPSQPPVSKGNGTELTAQDVSEVIQSYQLDANDAQVLEKLRGTYRNRDHFQATMAEIALARATKSTPTPAASISLTGGAGTQGVNAEALSAEMNLLYRNPSAPGAMQRITEIQELLKKAG